MTYEEKYKQALERARKIHLENRAQCFDIMEKVFPELKEDDDEEMLNSIIEDCKKYMALLPKQIAWLEKQKCYKPTDAQIEALRAAAYEAYKPNYITLQTLYEDLKKL